MTRSLESAGRPLWLGDQLWLRIALATTGTIGGGSLVFGGRQYRSTPSLRFASEAPVPLTVWGIALFVMAALLVTDIGTLGRIIGFSIGAAVLGFFTISYLWIVIHTSNSSGRNIVILMVFFDVVVFHIAAIVVTVQRKSGSFK